MRKKVKKVRKNARYFSRDFFWRAWTKNSLEEKKAYRLLSSADDPNQARVKARYLNSPFALIAQLGERQTEDLKVLCSIHSQGIFFLSLSLSLFRLLFIGIQIHLDSLN